MDKVGAQNLREAAERFRQIAQDHEDQRSPEMAERMRKVASDLDAEATSAEHRERETVKVNAMRKVLYEPKHWRDRAEEARACADEMRDARARRILVAIAESYERLIAHAERMAKLADR